MKAAFDQERLRIGQDERNRLALTGELVDVDSWAYWPLTFTHNVRAKKLGVVVVGCFETADVARSTPCGNVQWVYGEQWNELVIVGIDGLSPGTQYTVRLLVIGKEV